MYRLPLVLTFKNGSTLECIAKDTQRNKENQECMLVVQDGDSVIVVLDELESMRVSIENPHFDFIEFNEND